VLTTSTGPSPYCGAADRRARPPPRPPPTIAARNFGGGRGGARFGLAAAPREDGRMTWSTMGARRNGHRNSVDAPSSSFLIGDEGTGTSGGLHLGLDGDANGRDRDSAGRRWKRRCSILFLTQGGARFDPRRRRRRG
jgi:hypothetical protein